MPHFPFYHVCLLHVKGKSRQALERLGGYRARLKIGAHDGLRGQIGMSGSFDQRGKFSHR